MRILRTNPVSFAVATTQSMGNIDAKVRSKEVSSPGIPII